MNKLSSYLAMGILAILTGVGVVNSVLLKKDITDLNIYLINLFGDYCKDKGGLTMLNDTKIYLPEVKDTDDVFMASCRDGDQYGILIVNKTTERVVYYVTEE